MVGYFELISLCYSSRVQVVPDPRERSPRLPTPFKPYHFQEAIVKNRVHKTLVLALLWPNVLQAPHIATTTVSLQQLKSFAFQMLGTQTAVYDESIKIMAYIPVV